MGVYESWAARVYHNPYVVYVCFSALVGVRLSQKRVFRCGERAPDVGRFTLLGCECRLLLVCTGYTCGVFLSCGWGGVERWTQRTGIPVRTSTISHPTSLTAVSSLGAALAAFVAMVAVWRAASTLTVASVLSAMRKLALALSVHAAMPRLVSYHAWRIDSA